MIEERIMRFFNTFYHAHGCNFRLFADIFIRAYEGGTRGLNPVDARLIDELTGLMSDLAAAGNSTLPKLAELVKGVAARYIYLVDCLGLPDIYALWCHSSIAVIKAFINPQAVTQTFKTVFGARTMAEIAGSLGGLVLRSLDTMIHSEVFKWQDRNSLIDAIAARAEYVRSHLGPLAKPATVFFSDHGYDVLKDGDRYAAAHTGLKRPRLAKLSTFLAIK